MDTKLMTKILVHWTWDDTPDESLCGLDVSSEPWKSDDVEVNCERCKEIDELCKEYDLWLENLSD